MVGGELLIPLNFHEFSAELDLANGQAFFAGLSMEHNLSSSRPSIVRKIDDLMNIVRTL
jgi:hypothetical protein